LYELLILDIKMPKIDGFRLYEEREVKNAGIGCFEEY
jgi:YesN/AraC family two-component response regulator